MKMKYIPQFSYEIHQFYFIWHLLFYGIGSTISRRLVQEVAKRCSNRRQIANNIGFFSHLHSFYEVPHSSQCQKLMKIKNYRLQKILLQSSYYKHCDKMEMHLKLLLRKWTVNNKKVNQCYGLSVILFMKHIVMVGC